MNTVFLDKWGNARQPETWAEVKEAICKMWDSCEPCPNRGGHSRTEGGFECHHPLKEAPYKSEPNTSCAICRATAFRPDEECAKCPVEHKPESDKELADKLRSIWIHKADHAEPFGGDD